MEPEDVRNALSNSHLGFMFILTVGGMIFLGLKIDEWTGSSPWGVLAGLFLGFGFGFYYLVSTVFKQSDDGGSLGDRDEPRDPDHEDHRGGDEDTNRGG